MLMECSKSKHAGFTLIELMVALGVLAILVSVAVPSFQGMMQNSQIRNAAEAITNGLQKARGEAVSRNRNVEFLLGSNSSWTVQLASGAVIETRDSNEGSKTVTRVTVPAIATKVTFNNFGGVVANADSSNTLTRVTLSATGGSKSLRVDIGGGGIAKMCDPGLVSGSSPRAC